MVLVFSTHRVSQKELMTSTNVPLYLKYYADERDLLIILRLYKIQEIQIKMKSAVRMNTKEMHFKCMFCIYLH